MSIFRRLFGKKDARETESGETEIIPEPDQTVTHVSTGGMRYPRIRCGSEAEVGSEMDFCSDYFAKAGQYHAIGCDLEYAVKRNMNILMYSKKPR